MAQSFWTGAEPDPNLGSVMASFRSSVANEKQRRDEKEKQLIKDLMSSSRPVQMMVRKRLQGQGLLEKETGPGLPKTAMQILAETNPDTIIAKKTEGPIKKKGDIGYTEQTIIAEKGGSDFDKNQKAAGLETDETGFYNAADKNKKDKTYVSYEDAMKRIDEAAGRGLDKKIMEGKPVTMVDIEKVSGPVQTTKEIVDAKVKPELAMVGTSSDEDVNKELQKRDTEAAKQGVIEKAGQEASKQAAEADKLTVNDIFERSFNDSANPSEAYGRAIAFIENTARDSGKAELMKRQLMRMFESQKYTQERGVDKGMDEAMFEASLKGRGGGGGASNENRRLVMVDSNGKTIGNKEFFLPKGKSWVDYAKDNPAQYFKKMKDFVGSDPKLRKTVIDAEAAYKRDPRGYDIAQDIGLESIHRMMADRPMDTISTQKSAEDIAKISALATQLRKDSLASRGRFVGRQKRGEDPLGQEAANAMARELYEKGESASGDIKY